MHPRLPEGASALPGEKPRNIKPKTSGSKSSWGGLEAQQGALKGSEKGKWRQSVRVGTAGAGGEGRHWRGCCTGGGGSAPLWVRGCLPGVRGGNRGDESNCGTLGGGALRPPEVWVMRGGWPVAPRMEAGTPILLTGNCPSRTRSRC